MPGADGSKCWRLQEAGTGTGTGTGSGAHDGVCGWAGDARVRRPLESWEPRGNTSSCKSGPTAKPGTKTRKSVACSPTSQCRPVSCLLHKLRGLLWHVRSQGALSYVRRAGTGPRQQRERGPAWQVTFCGCTALYSCFWPMAETETWRDRDRDRALKPKPKPIAEMSAQPSSGAVGPPERVGLELRHGTTAWRSSSRPRPRPGPGAKANCVHAYAPCVPEQAKRRSGQRRGGRGGKPAAGRGSRAACTPAPRCPSPPSAPGDRAAPSAPVRQTPAIAHPGEQRCTARGILPAVCVVGFSLPQYLKDHLRPHFSLGARGYGCVRVHGLVVVLGAPAQYALKALEGHLVVRVQLACGKGFLEGISVSVPPTRAHNPAELHHTRLRRGVRISSACPGSEADHVELHGQTAGTKFRVSHSSGTEVQVVRGRGGGAIAWRVHLVQAQAVLSLARHSLRVRQAAMLAHEPGMC